MLPVGPGDALVRGTRRRHCAGSGELGVGVESPPPPLRRMAGAPYWPGNWSQRWVMIVSWVNDSGLDVPSFRSLSGADWSCYKGSPITAYEWCLDPCERYFVE